MVNFARAIARKEPGWTVRVYSVEDCTHSPLLSSCGMITPVVVPMSLKRSRLLRSTIVNSALYGCVTPNSMLSTLASLSYDTCDADPQQIRLLVRRISQENDIVHAGAWHAAYSSAISIGKRSGAFPAGTKYVCHALYHSTPLPPAGGPLRKHLGPSVARKVLDVLSSACMRATLSEFDATTVSTPYEYLVMRRIWLRSVHFIGEGIDLEYVENNKDHIVRRAMPLCKSGQTGTVAFVGARCYRKGYYHLLKAVESLLTSGEIVRLLAVGTRTPEHDAAMYNKITNLEAKLLRKGLFSSFEKVSEIQKYAVIAASHVLTLPSLDETIPLAVLEAWSLHKPVIVSELPTILSLGTKEGGLLVRFGDIEGIAHAIYRLLTDNRYGRILGEAGYRKVAEEFSLARVGERLVTLYRSL